MAPPSKRRRLLDPAQDALQQSDMPTKPIAAPFFHGFFHGVEHIEAATPTRTADARSSLSLVEEVHLQIRQTSISSAEDGLRLLRRQGTAALSDLISTNTNAEVVVQVTAEVDSFGSTTALATAAVTADLPDLPSLLSTSTTTSLVSDDSTEPSSAAGSSSSEPKSSSENSDSSNPPSSTSASSNIRSNASGPSPTYVVSPSSDSSDNDSSDEPQSDDEAQDEPTESGTGSSATPSSTAAPPSSTGGTAPLGSGRSSSPSPNTISDSDSSTSSNSSVPVSTSEDNQSQTSQPFIAGTVSGYTAQTASASSSNRLNLTTSASTSTSGSVVFISDFTVNLASVTSRTGSQSTDSSSSIDLNALFLATQSDGDVETFTRSSESFTTTLSDGQTATISPSSTGEPSSDASSFPTSDSVTTISDEGSTVRSTIFSTATASSTQSSSDEPDGVGLAGAVGGGATATSDGVASTSAAADNDDGDDDPAPVGTIAGGVVGGAAGLALVVLIVLLFLRRYKKRAQLGHRALPPNAAGTAAAGDGGSRAGGPGMAERAGLMPFAGAVPALFRHQNRSQNSGAETGERGFQRVGGRKLPSAFSEGMTGPPQQPMSPSPMSPPPTMPLVSPDDHERNLSSHSFYRDSAGFYGGDGTTSPNPNPFSDTHVPATSAGNEPAEQLTMSPGPQRRPTIHAAKSDVVNPSVATSGTPSWTPSSAAAFARSDTPASLDGSRNSRFTEEV